MKIRRTALVLSTVLVALASTAAAGAATTAYPGDVNGDGKVDFADLQAYSAANPSNQTVADIVKNWGTTAPPPSTGSSVDASIPSSQLAFSSWGEYTANKVSLGIDYGDKANRSVLRVASVAIPKGATVTNAVLTVNAPGSVDAASGTLNVRVAAAASDNPAYPTTAAGITGLPLTTARSGAWTSTAAAWTAGAHAAPSVASVVQEVVNRANWSSGNALEFVVVDNGSTGSGYFPGTSASLHVDYTTSTTGGTTGGSTGSTTAAGYPGPLTATGGAPFSATGPWNTAVPANPALDPASAAMVSTTAAKGATANIYAYADPVFTSTASDPLVKWTIRNYPGWGTSEAATIGVHMPAEAAPTTGSDGRMIIVDLAQGKSFDFWQASGSGSSWTASWSTSAALDDKDAVGTADGGATGGGLNALSGVIRTFEVRNAAAGNINAIPHTLAMATANSCSTFRYPAVKSDGSGGASCVPEGARMQLDPSIDVANLPNATPLEKAVAKAAQTYGIINRDNCGAPGICVSFEGPIGESDPYPAAGVPNDYWNLPHVPWAQMRVLASSVTQP